MASAYLDRRVTSNSPGVSASYAAGTDTTTWTVPYSVAVDGTEGSLAVVLTDVGLQLDSTTRPSATQIAVSGQGDLSSRPVVIGLTYRSEYRPTVPFLRGQPGDPVLSGELLLHRCEILTAETNRITVSVLRKGRAGRLVRGTIPQGGVGRVKVPVAAKRTDTTLTIGEESARGFALTALVWQGEYIVRARRV